MGTRAAIETEYAGRLFRSRLEARWAVFFDQVGIHWEYEPEGYETPAGRYLPDFRIYLRKLENPTALFEVKPASAAKVNEKCICPPLDPRWAYAVALDPAPCLLVACGIPSGGRIQEWIDRTGGLHEIKPDQPHQHAFPYNFTTCPCCEDIALSSAKNFDPPNLIKAGFDAAVSARFEYGAKGSVR